MRINKRNRLKVGDWLIIDEESGVTRYASEVRQDWRGLYVTDRYADPEHPQDFIRAFGDTEAVPYTNPPSEAITVNNSASNFVGQSGVSAPRGPFWHIYGN
jgi:hypothetical protein